MSLQASIKAKLEKLAQAAGKSRSAMVAQLVAREFEAAGLK
jgi:predicted transcriptional regulator